MALSGRLVFVAVLFGLTAAAGKVCGSDPPASDKPTDSPAAVAFALANVEFVLLHELAHVLIHDLEIPIIGPEENAADYLAATVLLRPDASEPVPVDRAPELLLATAEGLATSWQIGVASAREIRYWDSHALNIQRFYQIICLVYGSNPEAFARLPGRVNMPPARVARCPAEFARADRSLQWLLTTFGRQPDDPPGAEVAIRLDDPPTRVSQAVLKAMTDSGLLPATVVRLRAAFTLPEPFTIVVRRCRERQAAWLPDVRELVLCYELFDNFYLLGMQRAASRQGPTSGVHQPRRQADSSLGHKAALEAVASPSHTRMEPRQRHPQVWLVGFAPAAIQAD